MSIVRSPIQACRNCNRAVKFDYDDNAWIHVTYRSAHTVTFDGRQCELYAEPVGDPSRIPYPYTTT